ASAPSPRSVERPPRCTRARDRLLAQPCTTTDSAPDACRIRPPRHSFLCGIATALGQRPPRLVRVAINRQFAQGATHLVDSGPPPTAACVLFGDHGLGQFRAWSTSEPRTTNLFVLIR